MRPDTVATPSNTILVTSQIYNQAGWLAVATDPRGIMSADYYDNLGRVVRTVQAYTPDLPTPTNSSNQTTDFSYDNDGNRTAVTLVLPNAQRQTTQYIYGVNPGTGSAVTSNDMLYKVEYPDPGTGMASTTANQNITYTVNALGQNITMTDRNGTAHAYSYDVLGRQTSDTVTAFGSGVDQTIKRLDTAYDTQGNAYLLTSYKSTAGTIISIASQVQRNFNDLNQLTQEYQAMGRVNTNPNVDVVSPSVAYAYTDMVAGANNSRLLTMIYPNGETINYNYAGLDSAISRVTSISDTNPLLSNSTRSLEQDTYLGLSTVVQRTFPISQVSLSYIQQADQAVGDAGDQYTGLDRFGRIVDQNWYNTASSESLSDVQFGYDPDSNRLYANDLLNLAMGEIYHQNGAGSYDQFNQIGYFARGVLTQGRDSVSLVTGSTDVTSLLTSVAQTWTTDAIGNLLNAKTTDINGGQTTVARTYNAQNQITSVTGLGGAIAPQYDNNGNMKSDDFNNVETYDAWNRQVSFQTNPNNGNSSTTLRYYYDALGRRVAQSSSTPVSDVNWTLSYFNQTRQVIEERKGLNNSPAFTVSYQYVWSPVGGNTMTARLSNLSVGGKLTDLIFVLQDPIGSVSALVSAGQVVERYVYDPFGAVTILTLDWSVYPIANRASGLYNWQYFFQAGRYNSTSGQYNFDHRDLNPTEGRWVEMDPVGFGGGDVNQYRFAGNNPTDNTDQSGCFVSWVGAGVGALIGLGAYGITSLVTGNISNMSWGGAANAALNGAMAGAIGAAALTGDVSGAFILGLATGAVGGAAGSALQQGLDNGWSNINMNQVYVGALGGALGGGLGVSPADLSARVSIAQLDLISCGAARPPLCPLAPEPSAAWLWTALCKASISWPGPSPVGIGAKA